MKEFFVALDGLDSNEGTFESPFCSINRAKDAVRESMQTSTDDHTVFIKAGMYLLSKPLIFNYLDGGRENSKITYRAYKDDKVTLSGGIKVDNWTTHEKNIWKATCPVEDTRQFYANAKRMSRARGEADFKEEIIDWGHLTSNTEMQNWRNIQDIEVVYKDWWTLPRLHIEKIEGNKIFMQEPSFMLARTKAGRQIGVPTWIENAYELLTEPEEWYLDKVERMLYFIPPEGMNPNEMECIVPGVSSLLQVRSSSDNPIKNLEFHGIEFAHATWLGPNQYGVGMPEVQANVFLILEGEEKRRVMTPGNVYVEHADNLSFIRCKFTHLGGAGLDLRHGVKNSRVEGCSFYDISGSGIQVGEIYHPDYKRERPGAVVDIEIKNNLITKCAQEFKGGCGIFTGYVQDVKIEYNTVCNLPYTGISLGWGWSCDPTVCKQNSVSFNHIHSIIQELIDGGGIYTLSLQPGTIVEGNHIHDSGWNGLYPDERTARTIWKDNVVYRCEYSIQDHTLIDPKHNEIAGNYLDVPPFRTGFLDDPVYDANNWDIDLDQGKIKTIIQNAGIMDEYKDIMDKIDLS
ncbi:MAG: right-handed parallel beta-helix repeat-containing protein [Candidatus Hodarchaeota archaeon]